LVDDEECFHADVARHFRPWWTVVHAYNNAQAIDAIEKTRVLRAGLIDLNLPDGSGFQTMKAARRRFPAATLVALTASWDRGLLNEAYLLDGEYLPKEGYDLTLRFLAHRLRALELGVGAGVWRYVEELARGIKLTERETQVLALATAGCQRKRIAATLDISPETVKFHARSILLKADGLRLGTLARTLRGWADTGLAMPVRNGESAE
jgi:DNA-binding NarL/FixJ family response regulator